MGGYHMKWEYKYIYIDSKISNKKTANQINEELNNLGEDGWELVNFTTVLIDARYVFIFKRSKE